MPNEEVNPSGAPRWRLARSARVPHRIGCAGGLAPGRWPMRDVARLIGVTVVLMLPASVSAQSFALTPADLADSAAMSKSTIRLAAEVLATYRDTARTRYLDTRFRLELL